MIVSVTVCTDTILAAPRLNVSGRTTPDALMSRLLRVAAMLCSCSERTNFFDVGVAVCARPTRYGERKDGREEKKRMMYKKKGISVLAVFGEELLENGVSIQLRLVHLCVSSAIDEETMDSWLK